MADNSIKIKNHIKVLDISIDLSKPFSASQMIAKWGEIWPFLKEVLIHIRDAEATGKKIDKKIESVITLGDKVSNPKSLKSFVDAISDYLKVIRITVKMILTFIPAKSKPSVEKFIHILDWLEEGLRN